MNANIIFSDDTSIGCPARAYLMELPIEKFDDDEVREEIRGLIKEFYEALDGEFYPESVTFSDEKQD